jgi:hypothetical protein
MDLHAVLTSRRTRIGFLVGALLLYAALMGYGAFAGSSVAFALARVEVGVVLVGAVGFALAVKSVRTNLQTLAAVGYLAAGLLIGYNGLASLGVVPAVAVLGPAGDVALLVAFGAYFYQQRAGSDEPPDESGEDGATADEN